MSQIIISLRQLIRIAGSSFALTLILAACVTATPAALPEPTPLGGGAGLVAFTRDGALYVIRTDGSAQAKLVEGSQPAWSPDGKRIAFSAGAIIGGLGEDIHVMNANGTGKTRLTRLGIALLPAWSPDGRRIVFVTVSGSDFQIYVVNDDGSGLVQLTNTPRVLDLSPQWSPDGKQIAFYSNRDGNNEIYVMNTDGSAVTNLTSSPSNDSYPVWSPDGKYLAFSSDRDGNDEIYRMNTDGSGLTRITNNSAGDVGPLWSPDGTYILFVSDRDGQQEIYLMKADGSGQTRLTTGGGIYPAWQP